ncbi:MAG: flavin reductase family protein [Ruminococcaceae bacterium]|nr:flavin reductase family protein [Oscillospiraceae bacterium]
MANFKKISPEEIKDNPFHLIGKDWMLVTSANKDTSLLCGKDYNTMTASWGGVGVLWNKPVAYVFIRPQRHTFAFTEENDRMTLSFFDEEYRSALTFCGRNSGRDFDKAKECSLTPVSDENNFGKSVWFDEAKLVLKVRKLYSEFLSEKAFLDQSALGCYSNGDYHKMYICEIEEVLVRE